MVMYDNALYSGDPQAPQTGDTRIRWRAIQPEELTVVGIQQGRSVASSGGGGKLGSVLPLVKAGTHTTQEMFDMAHSENNMWTWLLRLGGFLMFLIGTCLMLQPIAVAPELIPLVGGLLSSIVGCGVFLASMAVATSLTAIVVAFAWFAARPMLAALLLAVAALPLVLKQGGACSRRQQAADTREYRTAPNDARTARSGHAHPD
jgi:hypothetical protein